MRDHTRIEGKSMETKVVNLFEISRDSVSQGPAFVLESPDLDCNYLCFDEGEGVPLHINAQVDVGGIVLEGEGFLQVDGQQRLLTEGDFFYIPKGTARKLRSAGGSFAYLSFHARRPCLTPEGQENSMLRSILPRPQIWVSDSAP